MYTFTSVIKPLKSSYTGSGVTTFVNQTETIANKNNQTFSHWQDATLSGPMSSGLGKTLKEGAKKLLALLPSSLTGVIHLSVPVCVTRVHDNSSKTTSPIRQLIACDFWSMRHFAEYDTWSKKIVRYDIRSKLSSHCFSSKRRTHGTSHLPNVIDY